MPLTQRRRPPPLVFVPRQAPAPAEEDSSDEEGDNEGPDSPDSVGTTPGLDSPDTPAGFGNVEEPPSPASQTPEIAFPTTPVTNAPIPASTTGIAEATSQVAVAPLSSGSPSSTNSAEAPTLTTPASLNSNPIPSSASGEPSSGATAQSEIAGVGAGGANVGADPPQQSLQPSGNRGGMSKGAEAALVTFTVLGVIALLIGAILYFRKRRRSREENDMRQAEDAFDPANNGSLPIPEKMYTSHFTQSTTSNPLYASQYQRPETISTDKSQSRIPPPQPTPNPFADPPLQKAYDVLRGRTRSTTLTDRGSWMKNPFKDPISERFDPFGELQEKARLGREKYLEDVRREQEILEKERMGLEPPVKPRKGSGATVEGVGILDRSGENRG